MVNDISLQVYRDRPKTLTETFENSAAQFPEKVALVHGEQRITYGELRQQVHNMAYQLRHVYGIQKGDRVALLLMNGIPFVVSVYAVLQIGAIAVPLNTKLKAQELEYMLQHSTATMLITNPEWWLGLSPLLKQIQVKYLFVTGDEEFAGAIPFRYLIEESAAEVVQETISEHDPAFIMYTSGTTGRPKGAVNTHTNMIHTAMNYAMCFGLTAEDSTLVAVPLFHITGLAAQLCLFIYLGGKIALMPMFKPDHFLQLLQDERITHVMASPTVYVITMMQPDYKAYDTAHLRYAVFGGAPMPAETVKMLLEWNPSLHLHNAYGLTETTSPSTLMPHQHQVRKLHTVGIPVPVGEVKIVDPETQQELSVGETGELLVKGPMVIRQYWQNEAATQQAINDGWLSTGDLAMLDEEGFVTIKDRIKDMINRGGEKIYSVEVEDVLYANTKVMEAAIVGVPDSTYGEVVKAYVVPRMGETLTEAEIKQWIAERLAKYKVPAYVEFLEALPRNPNGKVIKTMLRTVEAYQKS